MSNTLSAAPSLDDAQALRQANADWLSLALMDARNCTLRRLAMFEDAQALAPREAVSPLWLAGHGAWFQEYWLARHVQRTRGELAAPDGARLASIEPRADDWFGGATQDCQGLDAPTLRAYLAATLETTLELLETAADNDQGLYFYRMALMHEDRLCETLAELAMTWQLKVIANSQIRRDRPSALKKCPARMKNGTARSAGPLTPSSMNCGIRTRLRSRMIRGGKVASAIAIETGTRRNMNRTNSTVSGLSNGNVH